MIIRRKAPISFRRLLCGLAVLMCLCNVAFATETIPYAAATLTAEPSPDQLSIRLMPQMLGIAQPYYYTPDAAAQAELRTLMSELKLVPYTIDSAFWKDHPETGYTIVDPTNHAEWMMLDGDHILYTQYEAGDDHAFMHRRYAECPALTAYLAPLLASLHYEFVDVTTLNALTSVTLTLSDGQTETLTDPDTVYQFEHWITNAGRMRAPSCPMGNAMLTIVTGDGRSVDLLLASDTCPYFCINGVYYDYTPIDIRKGQQDGGAKMDNSFLFSFFPGVTFEPVKLLP